MMTTTKWLAAAALVTAIATPALAQDRMGGEPTRTEMKIKAKQERMAKRDAMRAQRDRDDRIGYRDDDDDVVIQRRGYAYNDGWNNGYWRQSNTGFWPGDVAANVVGGAVATAGAIAAAPLGGYNSYAYYDNGWNNNNWAYTDGWSSPPYAGQSYAQRNGFVCTPGTYFTAENGRRTLCQ